MAKLDFNRTPGQQSGYTNKAKNKNKSVLLDPGTYMACITKYERADTDKGVAIRLTFGVWKQYEGFIVFIPKWIGLGYKGNTADYALEDCIKIAEALNIPNVFDNEIGISPEDREKYILMKKIMVCVERGESYGENKYPINEIIGFCPYEAPTARPMEQKVEAPRPQPQPQYSPTPTNNPEAEYAAQFGGDDRIPF